MRRRPKNLTSIKDLIVSTKSSAGSSIEAAVTPNSNGSLSGTSSHHPSNGTSLVKKQKFCCSKPEEYEFIPKYAIERFILSGYRLNLSLKECFLSLFTLHNETMYVCLSIYFGVEYLNSPLCFFE
jgi:hypothetical protein